MSARILALMILAASLALDGCGGSSVERQADSAARLQEAGALVSAETAVKAGMRDPDSATFQDEQVISSADGGMIVCGHVNGRNGIGGQTGFQRFVWSKDPMFPHKKNVALEERSATIVDLVWAKCVSVAAGS